MKTYIQNKQVEADLELFASEDGIQRGIMCDSSGNIRTERVSATSQATWFFKTNAGKPYVWNGSIDPMAAFKAKLTAAIVAKIDQLRSEGTVAMAMDNLWAVVRMASTEIPCSNAYHYREVFRQCVDQLPKSYASFIL